MMKQDCIQHRLPWYQSARPRAIAFLLLTVLVVQGQDTKQKQPASPPAKNADNHTKHLPPLQFDGNAVLHHLNQVISWYRHATTGIQSVGLPSDTIYQDNAKSLGAQVVRLAFQSAKAEAALIKQQQKANDTSSGRETTQEQALTQMQTKVSAQIAQLQ